MAGAVGLVGSPLGNLFLTKPSPELAKSVAEQSSGYNHSHKGASIGAPPHKVPQDSEFWFVDHSRFKIGKGKKTYEKAKTAVSNWEHFQLGWSEVPNNPDIKVGNKLSVVAQSLFVWTVNPLEVAYVSEGNADLTVDEKTKGDATPKKATKGKRFCFGSTTLNSHMLSGEERFCVDYSPDDDSVWYDIYTFSRPANLLAWASLPVARYYQGKFVKESAAALKKAIAE